MWVREEVDPNLEVDEIHHRVHQAGGPAILFERVKRQSVFGCFQPVWQYERARSPDTGGDGRRG